MATAMTAVIAGRRWRSNNATIGRAIADVRARSPVRRYYAPMLELPALVDRLSLWPSYYGSSFWLNDPGSIACRPLRAYRWVRYYDDALLVTFTLAKWST